MKKESIFLIILAFLCVGQGFGPKIVKGPLPNSASAPWKPTDAPLIRYYWHYADNEVGQNVTNWIDRIQGLALTNSAVAKQPTNSTLGVWFSGATFLTNTPFSVTTGGALTQTVFAVLSPIAPATGYGPVFSGNTSIDWEGGYGFFLTSGGNRHYFGQFGSGAIGVTAAGTTWDIVLTISDVTHGDVFYTNGVQAVSTSWGSWANQGSVGYDKSISGFYKGYIKEIAFYWGILSAANISNLHWYSTNTYSYTP